MSRRILQMIVLGTLLLIAVGCTNKKAVNPLANVGSKQPDKVLFDKAMDAMHHNRFDVARLTLQTLINTYPDSEFVARAKLAVGDSWYAEGGTAALAQAEQEYDDFETFFPNMPEAAEAQLKIANIHYQQMEKADRDFTHAKRAEDEYRKMILTYPDSKLLPEAKQRLLEVQEVLGEREFEIGRFYYLRESYVASEARLQSLINQYPLYSKADEALYLLGQSYEGQVVRIRNSPTCDAKGLPRGCSSEAGKAKVIGDLSERASKAYGLILTRYPMMDRTDDAKHRLEALKQPVPRPTKAAVAQNKAEIASRRETNLGQKLLSVIKKSPDTTMAAKVGEPSLTPAELVAPSDIVHSEIMGASGAPPVKGALGLEVVRPDPPPGTAPATDNSLGGSPFGKSANNTGTAPPAADPNELKPNAAPDNELKPADTGIDPTLPPPAQVNEIHSASSSSATADDDTLASDKDISSSKKKKKKGLKKLNPF
jgi:outer membrane protein assembly factor BamD